MEKAKNKKRCGLEEYNLENIRNITVASTTGSHVVVKARDLREMLYRYGPDYTVKIGHKLLYQIFIDTGIVVKGFKPNKTALRHTYGLSIERINEVLPGSYTSKEGDGRRRGNPK